MGKKTASKEKILKGRKRRRKRASKGHVLRVSDLVMAHINSRRLNNKDLSCDAYLRLAFGLPDRSEENDWIQSGRPAQLLEGWVDGFILPKSRGARFYLEEKDANGAAVELYAKKKVNRLYKPVRVREVK